MTTEANHADDALDKIKTAYEASRGTLLPLWDDLEDGYRRAMIAMWFAGDGHRAPSVCDPSSAFEFLESDSHAWTSSSEHDAQELVRERNFIIVIDVVFTDIQLAGSLSGWDVAEEGRTAQAVMPVIYTSGNPVDRSRRVHDSLFFEKPLEVLEACRRLRRADI
jgi:CheY-like chemotaxis protein